MTNRAELRRLCSDIENCGGIAQLMRGGLFSKWVELVNPTAVLSLLDECERLQATCDGLDRQNDSIAEEIGRVANERDAALAEIEARRIQVSTLTEWYSNALDVIREVTAAIPGVTYMDPPDGGDVSIPEQIRRMAKDAERYRWLRPKQTFIWLIQDWFPGGNSITDVDAEIDTAMSQEAKA